jgi:tetratricopeptide (TPR) repeat protein
MGWRGWLLAMTWGALVWGGLAWVGFAECEMPLGATPMTVGLRLDARPALDPEPAVAHAESVLRAARDRGPRAVLETRLWCVALLRESAAREPERGADALEIAGGHLSALGLHAEALEAFDRAANACRQPSEAMRVTLEAAHAARRMGRHAAALERYQQVREGLRADPMSRQTATYWYAAVSADDGHSAQALKAWKSLALGSGDVFLRIDAFDALALHALEHDSAEAAAGWLLRCRLELAELAREATDRGARVRRCMLRMRALVATKVAVAERDGWSPALHEPVQGLSR